MRDVIAVSHTVFVRVARRHPIAHVIKNTPHQERRGTLQTHCTIDRVLLQFGLDLIEEGPVQDGLMLPGVGLTTVVDLSNVKPVTEHVGEGADPKGNPAPGFSIGKRSDFRSNSLVLQNFSENRDRSNLKIEGKNRTD